MRNTTIRVTKHLTVLMASAFLWFGVADGIVLEADASWMRQVAGVAIFQSLQGREPVGFPKPADLPLQPSLPDPLVMLDGRKIIYKVFFGERAPFVFDDPRFSKP